MRTNPKYYFSPKWKVAVDINFFKFDFDIDTTTSITRQKSIITSNSPKFHGKLMTHTNDYIMSMSHIGLK